MEHADTESDKLGSCPGPLDMHTHVHNNVDGLSASSNMSETENLQGGDQDRIWMSKKGT